MPIRAHHKCAGVACGPMRPGQSTTRTAPLTSWHGRLHSCTIANRRALLGRRNATPDSEPPPPAESSPMTTDCAPEPQAAVEPPQSIQLQSLQPAIPSSSAQEASDLARASVVAAVVALLAVTTEANKDWIAAHQVPCRVISRCNDAHGQLKHPSPKHVFDSDVWAFAPPCRS
jgi:hypothetical protein